ncbi:GNAT family N-acetyltransferase [Candidatus Bathyarchaeota archaeon]|nr:GNAT family N-acetyltransferase [Candidatus Bathyarchaeota archaeon]
MALDLEFYPLTSERWVDLEKLFGKHGACGGCWCMWWRLSRADFNRNKGEGNRKAFKKIVDSGHIPGILAYFDGQPVGWCAVAPRESFPMLERSRTLKRVDDRPVWSVVCFFMAKLFRRKGLTVKLLEAAIKYVEAKGGNIVEGYPTGSAKAQPDPFMYTGLASSFRKVGFVEVLRRSRNRPIMRYVIGKKKK